MNTLRHQKFRFNNSFARAGLWPIFFAGMLVLHAQAGPIIYTFTGVGSGSVNGTAFNNARFTIEAFADTANVGRYIIPDQPDLFVLSVGVPSSTINIEGIGLASFTTAKVVFVNQTVRAAGFSEAGTPFPDLYDFQNSAFASYDLRSSFGPIFDPASYIISSQFSHIPSTLGDISFSSFTSPQGGTFMAREAPVSLICPTAAIVECGNIAEVTVPVSDSDGYALTVVWEVNGTAVQTNRVPASGSPTLTNVSFLANLPLGTNIVEVVVADSMTNAAFCSTTVTVINTTSPEIVAAAADPSLLWPPNHQMIAVDVSAQVTDSCSPTSWAIIEVRSNEPTSGQGHGNTVENWEITGDHTVNLRSERYGTGKGRIYSIAIQARDESGNLSSVKIVPVTVPKSPCK